MLERCRRSFCVTASLLLLLLVTSATSRAAPTPGALQTSDHQALVELLEQQRTEHRLPALAAAVYQGDRLVAAAAVGVRRAGTSEAVTDFDLFHVGSVTKSMTATMIGVLVERGLLRWDSRIFEVLPELADGSDPGYAEVTLTHLLAHTAGVHDPFTAGQWADMPRDTDTSAQRQRLQTAREVLAVPPLGTPGEVWEYSNTGYTIAAAMAERVAGEPWQNLMRRLVFGPLGMASAGFGWPATVADPDQPWGHVIWDEDEPDLIDGLRIWPPGHPHWIPTVIESAGDVHMNVADFGRWAGMHLRGLRGAATLVSPETMTKLHTPLLEDYALGWNIIPDGTRSLPDAEQHQHLGSGGTFQAVEAVFPTLDVAVVVVHNGGSNTPAVAGAMYELARRYGGVDPR